MYNAHLHVQAAFILARKPHRGRNLTALQLLTLLVYRFMMKIEIQTDTFIQHNNSNPFENILLYSIRANILHFKKMQIVSGDVDNRIDHRVTDVFMYYIQARITAKFK